MRKITGTDNAAMNHLYKVVHGGRESKAGT